MLKLSTLPEYAKRVMLSFGRSIEAKRLARGEGDVGVRAKTVRAVYLSKVS